MTVDLTRFPASSRITVEALDRVRVLADGVDVSDVGAWYARRFGATDPLVKRHLTREEWNDIYAEFETWLAVESEKAVFLTSLLRFLEACAPVVNPVDAFIGHTRKHHQVWTLRRAGLRVPDFLASNDLDDLRAFAKRQGRVVYKPVAGRRHVRELSLEYLESKASALATEPVLVQALVDGRHVRVYVVGDRVVGAGEVLFDREVGVDYRASQRGTEVVDLAPNVQRDCVRAARACGMDWTGLDLILDGEGTAHFLECNPSAMFANFERATGLAVSAALADLVLARAAKP